MSYKTCHKCFQRLPLSEFYANPHYTDGYSDDCKECTREARRKHYNAKEKFVRAEKRIKHQAIPKEDNTIWNYLKSIRVKEQYPEGFRYADIKSVVYKHRVSSC
jgi:peptidase E